MSSFYDSLNNFIDEETMLAEKVIRKVIFDILSELIMTTPMDTGRAAGNWNVSLDIPDLKITFNGGSKPKNEADKTKNRKLAMDAAQKGAADAIKNFELGDIVHFVNNVEYIEFLNDGSSQQAGAEFVEKIIQKHQTALVQAMEAI